MTNRVLSIQDHDFKREDQLFLDANIWLFIFGPQNRNKLKVDIYSSAFRRILEANCGIFIDVLVVSEFINTYSRILYRQSGSRFQFKNFRNNPQFIPIAQEIADNIERILSYCSRLNNQFDELAISKLIYEYAKGGTDFNDQVIGNLCRSRNLKLITDDQDFKGQGLSVLTANLNLLR